MYSFFYLKKSISGVIILNSWFLNFGKYQRPLEIGSKTAGFSKDRIFQEFTEFSVML